MSDRAGDPRLVWGVAALLQAVADAIAARWSACVVSGELAAFSRAASGHCYFSLKDADGAGALIRCAMFRRAASLLAFTPREGQRVEIRGRVAIYEPRGELQFVVESMQLAGAGSIHEEFLKLKARLAAEGLFDPERKRPLPGFPRAVGIVTSTGAAALRDVLTTLARRAPHLRVVVYPTPVQGADAPPAIVQALAQAQARAEVDAVLLCRGGGSMEDLWAFNDERVVRAVAACRLPVVCGVGHETDVTLSDFAADLRAATPTAGAELIAPRSADALAHLAQLHRHLSRRVRQRLDVQAQRLDASLLRMSRPLEQVRRHEQRLALLARRLREAPRGRLQRASDLLVARADRLGRSVDQARRQQAHRLDVMAARLASIDPARVLRRGYAWLLDAGGTAVSSVGQLQAGDRLRAVVVDGEFDATVDRLRPAAGASTGPAE